MFPGALRVDTRKSIDFIWGHFATNRGWVDSAFILSFFGSLPNLTPRTHRKVWTWSWTLKEWPWKIPIPNLQPQCRTFLNHPTSCYLQVLPVSLGPHSSGFRFRKCPLWLTSVSPTVFSHSVSLKGLVSLCLMARWPRQVQGGEKARG
jgi:hypothetical protein